MLCKEGDAAWFCTRCRVSASSLNTVALLAVGTLKPADWAAVAQWVEAEDLVDADTPRHPGTKEVAGFLPPLDPLDESVRRAIAAGVPEDLAVWGALEYRLRREEARERSLELARCAWKAAVEFKQSRGAAVFLWRDVSDVTERITIPLNWPLKARWD